MAEKLTAQSEDGTEEFVVSRVPQELLGPMVPLIQDMAGCIQWAARELTSSSSRIRHRAMHLTADAPRSYGEEFEVSGALVDSNGEVLDEEAKLNVNRLANITSRYAVFEIDTEDSDKPDIVRFRAHDIRIPIPKEYY